jgi:SagB-type dehydrogenase family enzyme
MLRRASSLVLYWDGQRLLFENYATGVRIFADPLAAQILHFFHRWRSVEALAAHFSDFTPASLFRAVAALERHTLLQRSDAAEDARTRAMSDWSPWNPSAGFFHFSTKDVRFSANRAALDRALRRKAKTSPMPPVVKRYPGAAVIKLPQPVDRGEFPRVLLSRRTHRQFAPVPVRLADLGTLLGLTWGVQDWLVLPGIGRSPMKTSPSGGARQPIEVYVVVRNVEGLAPGIYHYAADRHVLELMRRGATAHDFGRYLPAQPWFRGAAVLTLMTAIFARTRWKYQSPRAYRVVLAEAGHLCQTFCLTATWLGLAPFCTMALADSKIEAELGLDGITESALYAAGVGTRPVQTVPRRTLSENRRGSRNTTTGR